MSESLRLYVQKITKLPTLPVIAQEILRLVNNDMITIDKLEKIIENDPAITAKVLSVSNSAYFGIKTSTKSLGSAIMRIGFNNVKNIAIGVALMTVIDDGTKDRTLDYQKVFNHSITVGFVVRMMTKEFKSGVSEEIMMDGILHDIGFLILSRYFSQDYRQVLEDYKESKSLLKSEEAVFDFTHAEIGHWLAEQWKLPPTILDAVMYHHKPALAVKNQKRVALIHLADYITSRSIMSPTEIDPNYPLDPAALEILGLSEGEFKALEEKVLDNMCYDGADEQ